MKVPILMYHKVASWDASAKIKSHYVEPRQFERHLRLLRSFKFEVVPLTEIQERSSARRIVITFDDGYENFYKEALPILHSFGYPSTVFLVSNQLGGTNAWDVGEGEPSERLMNKTQILDSIARATGFGSHTADHADLTAISLEDAKEQILGSKLRLEKELEMPIDTFCYPYGRKNRDIQALVASAGYRFACSTEKGVNLESTDPMVLKRINVRRETSNPVLMYKLWRGMALGK